MSDMITEFLDIDPEELHLVREGATGFPVIAAKSAGGLAATRAILEQLPEPTRSAALKGLESAGRPSIPAASTAASRARTLTPADLSGGATTIADGTPTSLLEAYRRFCDSEVTRADATAKGSLMAFYTAQGFTPEEAAKQVRKTAKRLAKRAARAGLPVAAAVPPELVEAHAFNRATRAVSKALDGGATATAALDSGFAKYRSKGGRSGRALFVRALRERGGRR
jgi:hypothetical protein